MRFRAVLAAAGPLLLAGAAADPTWPSSIDELEEIMYQLSEFETRNFADTINPCTNEASGPGRQNAAEWLRVGFHDMSTADALLGVGGLDASIQYELGTGENLGPGFNTTLRFMANFLTSRSSMADLIALGVYASVRSCGGPAVPFRAGRIDAAGPGRLGVPQPDHQVEQFWEQFARMGFSHQEMIQVTACGHTIGGVHEDEFPELLLDGEAPLDSSVADFDNRIVTEYLASNSTNPLVVGPAVALGKDSDARIFASDGNVTAQQLADRTVFNDVCQAVLQKMIDVVPAGVKLSDPVLPYQVKPVEMRLTLNNYALAMRLSGLIRVRTTDLPKDLLGEMTLTYKDRNGGNDCRYGCTSRSTFRGVSYGFDDSFVFYPIDAAINATTGISSYTISIFLKNGTTLFFDNNGHGYPIQDAAMVMRPFSCLNQHTGETNVLAAIRNDRADMPATLTVTYKEPRAGLVVPGLYNHSVTMTRGECAGHYTLYRANWTIPGNESHSARLDVASGSGADVVVDDFYHAVKLPGACNEYHIPPPNKCAPVTVSMLPSLPSSSSVVAPPPLPSTTMATVTTTPYVVAVHTSAVPAVSSTPVAATRPLSDGRPHDFEPGLLVAVKGFFGSLISEVASFFGYDRYQMVNNELDR